jgi:formylglycine-generating enzyme required for sulfatase activity
MGMRPWEWMYAGSWDGYFEATLTHDFVIQSTEVTQDQFGSVRCHNPSTFASCGGDCPVETVLYRGEMEAYLNDLSRAEGLDECYACTYTTFATSPVCEPRPEYANAYDCPGYRLPTEAEWEFAARAGSDARTYAGDVLGVDTVSMGCGLHTLDGIAWWSGSGADTTHPVASLAPNSWGLFDVHGNVHETCHDHEWSLPDAPTVDPVGPDTGLSQAIRGGAWNSDWSQTFAGLRGLAGWEASSAYGFRTVRTVTFPCAAGDVGDMQCRGEVVETCTAGAAGTFWERTTDCTTSGMVCVPGTGTASCQGTGCGDGLCTGGETATTCACDCFTEGDGECASGEVGSGSADCAGPGHFVRVCKGTFMMGLEPGEIWSGSGYGEAPFEATLTHDFMIQSTEVTRSQFFAIMGGLPTGMMDCSTGDDCPVDFAMKFDAQLYCNALSSAQGLPECYSCVTLYDCVLDAAYSTPYECPGYRLPTEAEWEYAARAGMDGWTYLGDVYGTTPEAMGCRGFGMTEDIVDLLGWWSGNSGDVLHEPGLKPPNPWGLYDMYGNASEMVLDTAWSYPTSPTTDPMGPVDGWMCRRGGQVTDDVSGVTSSYRSCGSWSGWIAQDSWVGFRPVRSIIP